MNIGISRKDIGTETLLHSNISSQSNQENRTTVEQKTQVPKSIFGKISTLCKQSFRFLTSSTCLLTILSIAILSDCALLLLSGTIVALAPYFTAGLFILPVLILSFALILARQNLNNEADNLIKNAKNFNKNLKRHPVDNSSNQKKDDEPFMGTKNFFHDQKIPHNKFSNKKEFSKPYSVPQSQNQPFRCNFKEKQPEGKLFRGLGNCLPQANKGGGDCCFRMLAQGLDMDQDTYTSVRAEIAKFGEKLLQDYLFGRNPKEIQTAQAFFCSPSSGAEPSFFYDDSNGIKKAIPKTLKSLGLKCNISENFSEETLTASKEMKTLCTKVMDSMYATLGMETKSQEIIQNALLEWKNNNQLQISQLKSSANSYSKNEWIKVRDNFEENFIREIMAALRKKTSKTFEPWQEDHFRHCLSFLSPFYCCEKISDLYQNSNNEFSRYVLMTTYLNEVTLTHRAWGGTLDIAIFAFLHPEKTVLIITERKNGSPEFIFPPNWTDKNPRYKNYSINELVEHFALKKPLKTSQKFTEDLLQLFWDQCKSNKTMANLLSRGRKISAEMLNQFTEIYQFLGQIAKIAADHNVLAELDNSKDKEAVGFLEKINPFIDGKRQPFNAENCYPFSDLLTALYAALKLSKMTDPNKTIFNSIAAKTQNADEFKKIAGQLQEKITALKSSINDLNDSLWRNFTDFVFNIRDHLGSCKTISNKIKSQVQAFDDVSDHLEDAVFQELNKLQLVICHNTSSATTGEKTSGIHWELYHLTGI